jgi:hypothetical protein
MAKRMCLDLFGKPFLDKEWDECNDLLSSRYGEYPTATIVELLKGEEKIPESYKSQHSLRSSTIDMTHVHWNECVIV